MWGEEGGERGGEGRGGGGGGRREEGGGRGRGREGRDYSGVAAKQIVSLLHYFLFEMMAKS